MPKNRPQMRCDNCETVNELDFDPRKYYNRLKGFKCRRCRKLVCNEKQRLQIAKNENMLTTESTMTTKQKKALASQF